MHAGHCISVSNHAFLCQTRDFSVEPGILVSNECSNFHRGQVTKVGLSCFLVLLSFDSKR